MGKYTRGAAISALTFLSQVPQVQMHENCTNADHCANTNWVHIWYIWFIAAVGGLLLSCALVCLCVRWCCLNCHPTEEDTSAPPYEVTVIAFDHDSSTLQSTITSLHSVFGPAAKRILAVAHAHSAVQVVPPPAGLETPPIYEEAIHMSRFTVAQSRERTPELQSVSEEKQTSDDERRGT